MSMVDLYYVCVFAEKEEQMKISEVALWTNMN